MITIIAGTNRPKSRSFEVSQVIQKKYAALGLEAGIMNLAEFNFSDLNGSQYGEGKPQWLEQTLEKIHRSEGLVIVCPEYNGSYPGILKYFIDHWSYPESFEYRPISLIGLGGRFGGLRPVEHLQGVFGYRNAFIYPERVFLSDIWSNLKEGQILNETMDKLLDSQCSGFSKFIEGLKSKKLDANSRRISQ